MTEIQHSYQEAIRFAAAKHAENNQTIPGTNLPYVVHISNVAMEILATGKHPSDFDLGFAIQLALLHDTLEDTSATFEEIAATFSVRIAEGVAALTKNEHLPKEERMTDSLERIRSLSKEVAAVKLADRITNLQEPPKFWNTEKRINYQREAQLILDTLKGENPALEERLQQKIVAYGSYIQVD